MNKYLIALGGMLAALPAFAVADADGMVGTLDFTALTANVSSVIGQVFPVVALVAGIALAFAVARWIIARFAGVLGRARI